MINTKNLHLLPCELIHVKAILRGKSELAAMLHVDVPASWPHFPEAFSLPANESHTLANAAAMNWPAFLFIHPKDKVLVGSGGFKGQPDAWGAVEIGYEIASEHWNRGFATEAARGMIEYAFAHTQVQAVFAHTLAQTNASNKVLQKVGMRFMAEVDDPDEGRIWRWQISRDQHRLMLQRKDSQNV